MDTTRTVYQVDASSPGSEAAADAAAALAAASIPFRKVDRNYSSVLLKNSRRVSDHQNHLRRRSQLTSLSPFSSCRS